MAGRFELPTKAQISALTDPTAIKALIEDIDGVVATIETRLSYSGINDEDWRERAQGALIRHKRALSQLNRRLHEVRLNAKFPTRSGAYKTKAKTKVENIRPADDNDPLTNEVLERVYALDLKALVTVAQVEAQLAWVEPRILAVERDRTDEIALPSAKRDESFLAATKSTLSALRNARTRLQTHRNLLSRGDKETRLERQARRERQFVDAARDLLPAATFQAIWDRVERQEVEESATRVAA